MSEIDNYRNVIANWAEFEKAYNPASWVKVEQQRGPEIKIEMLGAIPLTVRMRLLDRVREFVTAELVRQEQAALAGEVLARARAEASDFLMHNEQPEVPASVDGQGAVEALAGELAKLDAHNP